MFPLRVGSASTTGRHSHIAFSFDAAGRTDLLLLEGDSFTQVSLPGERRVSLSGEGRAVRVRPIDRHECGGHSIRSMLICLAYFRNQTACPRL